MTNEKERANGKEYLDLLLVGGLGNLEDLIIVLARRHLGLALRIEHLLTRLTIASVHCFLYKQN